MMVGVAVRLHGLDGDDVGVVHVPPPIEVGDLIASAHALFRVLDVITSPPGSPIGAIAKVKPEHVAVVAR
jgi:hypothetical protein